MRVSPETLMSKGSSLGQVSGEYHSTIREIYSELDRLRDAWEGASSNEYMGKLESYRGNIEAVGRVINNYGIFLQETGRNLEQMEADNAAGAARL